MTVDVSETILVQLMEWYYSGFCKHLILCVRNIKEVNTYIQSLLPRQTSDFQASSICTQLPSAQRSDSILPYVNVIPPTLPNETFGYFFLHKEVHCSMTVTCPL